MPTFTATLRNYSIGEDRPWGWNTFPDGLGPGTHRMNATTVVGRHGAAPLGRDWLSEKRLSFALETDATIIEGPDAEAAIRDLTAAWAPEDSLDLVTLTLQMTDAEYQLLGRPESCDIDAGTFLHFGVVYARVTFLVLDPLWYSSTWKAETVTPTEPGTWTLPMTLPITFGVGTGGPQDVTVTNDGTADAPWRVTLVGPLTSPRISLNGRAVVILGDIAAGSSATVDSRSQSVTVDGVYQSWLSIESDWWEIPPGSSTFSLRAQAGTGTATLRWQDASK